MKKRIAILGSTGSIGVQALDVIAKNTDLFEIEVLTAQSNADLLIRQALQFQPNAVVIGDENLYSKVYQSLDNQDIKVFAGKQSLTDIVEMSSIDMVLVAVVGIAGLAPTLRAIEAGKSIALANKETLVAGGAIITKAIEKKGCSFIPVDSEHSAIFQCLSGELHNKIESLTLTSSGGPFFGKQISDLQHITPSQALKHPNWSMGNKVTIDSATLMNKGLEMIEAHWLFDVSPQNIDIVVHPQSIVHSLVHFTDGSIKAQLSLPDMRLPIQYALSYPYRIDNQLKRFSFADYSALNFYSPDREVFPCLELAYEALRKGGNMPCCLNAANELAVEAFLNEKLPFLSIPKVIEKTMQLVDYQQISTISDCLQTDSQTRKIAKKIIEKL
ncbi:MAG: 1-deoxy-D-xylulose-5-phosphate reductoisomerase [Bacteroidales bacterium]|jgi:1-deoxy-D-xylulose-5-phosphate reductoisomerase|nr:1-deoxy-D-xylulose-5-phosphate reductoisomerase [Bacteroidales bacterium]